jgi:integrase
MARKPEQAEKVRTYPSYLRRLEAVGKSPLTIKAYRLHLMKYARFLDVRVEDLHRHLVMDDVVEYALSMKNQKANTRKTCLFVLKNFMEYCGKSFDKFETDVFRVESNEERLDKPLPLETLQKMMDVADIHGKSILTFLISTGCRAGECSKILLSDVKDDTVTLRNDICKGKRGGVAFLTSEARQYLDLWVGKERDSYIKMADIKSGNLATRINGRPKNDQRLFGCSYMTINKIFKKLYDLVDGEQSGGRNRITAHGTRAYFRTRAPMGMSIDLVEGILRHVGYLNASYVRMSDGEKYQQFKAGEAALFITRADHRVQSGKLSALEREVETLRQERAASEARLSQVEQERAGIRAAGAEYVKVDDVQKMIRDALLAAGLKR